MGGVDLTLHVEYSTITNLSNEYCHFFVGQIRYAWDPLPDSDLSPGQTARDSGKLYEAGIYRLSHEINH